MPDEPKTPKYVEKRVRYFDGQYLSVNDFDDEQSYHIDRQRRISQFLQVSGILEGLDVTIDANKTRLRITPGVALDDQGRQILLSSEAMFGETPIKLQSAKQFEIDLSDTAKFPRNQSYHLLITWDEVETDPQTEGGGTGNTRYYERPKLLLQPSQNQSPAASVFLALLNSASDGFTIGTSDRRQYSGLKLPASNNNGVTLRSLNGAGDRAVLNGSLSITGNLTVTGTSTLNGNTTIAGTSTLTGNVGIGSNPETGASANKLRVTGNTAIAGNLSTTGSNGNLTVEGTSTLTGNVGIGSNPETGASANKLRVTGNTAIVGNLSTSGADGNLTVAGTSTLNGRLTVNHEVSLRGAQNATGLTVKASGNVGIGTTTPSYMLQVGDPNTEGSAKFAIAGRGRASTNTPHWRTWTLRTGDGTNSGDIHKLRVRDENINKDRLTIDENGKLGIGISSPSATLHIVPESNQNTDMISIFDEANAKYARIGVDNQNNFFIYDKSSSNGAYISLTSGSSGWHYKSDISLKRNIVPLNEILDKVMKLRPVQFIWKQNNTEDFGFIAQEVEKIFPEIVSISSVDNEPLKGISCTHFGVLAIRAIQEMAEKIQALEDKIAELSNKSHRE